MAAGAGEVAALMKGSLHTDVLLHAIMQKEAKLRTGRLISHCAMMSVPTYARRFVLSDVALNIAPDTDQKRDICQNAIGFARALGIDLPKVAVLAAVETVRTKMPATLDGAILAKMADRGQIVGGIVDGPLDLDAAVDAEAARIKHISSPVAGLRRCADRAEHRGRQHGLQEPRLHGRCADRGPGGRRAGAGDPDQPRRHARRAPLLGRRRGALRRCAGARSRHPAARNSGVIGHERGHHRLQRGLHQPEVRRLCGGRDRDRCRCSAAGRIDSMQGDPHFIVKDAAGKPMAAHEWGEGHTIDHRTALHFVITWLEANLAGTKVVAAGHRVVLGGTRFEAPVLIDADVLDYLDSLVVMEPSHQPFNVRGARAFAEAFPGLPQVACFDTSFHRTMPEVAQIYALPKDVRDDGVRHWGYHGISYDYISRQVPKFAPGARRVIAAHLGGGASLCAMLDGKSIETTMGFGARVRTADGDALGRRAAGRSVLPAAPQAVRRRVAGEDAVRARGPARSVRHQRRHAGACRRARIRGRSRR